MVKHKIEALLFSSGRKMKIEEISKLCNQKPDVVLKSLQELRDDYQNRSSSLMVIEEGDYWKITVREQHLGMVRKIVAETELSKSVIETLAVIAFKYPILQSKLIQIRTNKAYDHLRDLEEAGYIARQKHGRTKIIKLTQKFFEYFDLAQDKLKDHFKDFKSIAKAIEEKEVEIDKIKIDQKKKAEEAKKQDIRIKEEVDKLDITGHFGELAVVDIDTNNDESKEQKHEKVELIFEEYQNGEEQAADIKEKKEEELQESPQEEEGEQQEQIQEKERPEGVIIQSQSSIPIEKASPNQDLQFEFPELEQEAEEAEIEQKTDEPKISEEEADIEVAKPLPPDISKRVEQEIDKMLNPPREEQQTKQEEKKQEREEAKDLLEANMEEGDKEK